MLKRTAATPPPFLLTTESQFSAHGLGKGTLVPKTLCLATISRSNAGHREFFRPTIPENSSRYSKHRKLIAIRVLGTAAPDRPAILASLAIARCPPIGNRHGCGSTKNLATACHAHVGRRPRQPLKRTSPTILCCVVGPAGGHIIFRNLWGQNVTINTVHELLEPLSEHPHKSTGDRQ
jgi:hypothetical protein